MITRVMCWCRCNLRCQYCMPSQGVTLTPHSHLLTQDEIVRIAEIFASEGVKKVKLLSSNNSLTACFRSD